MEMYFVIRADEGEMMCEAITKSELEKRLNSGYYGSKFQMYEKMPEEPDMNFWDRALIIDRDLYPAYLARGLGRMKKGDFAGAAEDFTEVLRIQPDEPEATRFLSELGL